MKEKKTIRDTIQQAADILNNIKEFNDKILLENDVLRAAVICKFYDELTFADFIAKCEQHKEVTISLFNDAVTTFAKSMKKELSHFEDKLKIIKINSPDDNENIFQLPPLPNGLTLKIPEEYTCSINGIVIDKVTPSGKHNTKFVAYSPFFIVERLKNIDDNTEKLKAVVYTPQGWDFIISDRYDFSEEHRLVILSRYGLAVDSSIARDTVVYISELLRQNINIIPVTKIVSQTGWRDNFKKFIYPPSSDGYMVDTGTNDEISEVYKIKGDFTKWLNHYQKIKKYDYARMAFNAALAAPLIEIIGMRNMTLCIWGRSGGGKTAGVIKFPMSIYGDPKYIPTFNSTFNSLERRAVNSNNFPFAVDELQNITNSFQLNNIDKFAHIIGEGVSKGRTARSGNLEILKRFSTIALITGEQPLTRFTSDLGKKRRTVEYHCEEVLPVELAEETHEFVTKHYGLLGREWVEVIKNNINEIKTIYKYLKKVYREKRPEVLVDHLNFLAAAYTAEVIFDVNIRNLNFDKVWANLRNSRHVDKIINELSKEKGTSSAERARDFIREFIASRLKHFLIDENSLAIDPVFGIVRDNIVAIYPNRLKTELKREGFSPEKVINELIEEGFFMKDQSGNPTHKIRFKQNKIEMIASMYIIPNHNVNF